MANSKLWVGDGVNQFLPYESIPKAGKNISELLLPSNVFYEGLKTLQRDCSADYFLS
jgi:hypothetical protein